jgi:hypothetical protein
MTAADREELAHWLEATRERLRRLPLDEVAALRRAFGSAWFTARDVCERPQLLTAIGARSPDCVGARLRDLRQAGAKGGLALASGTRVRDRGLRWRVVVAAIE